jgi:hypothetical protein
MKFTNRKGCVYILFGGVCMYIWGGVYVYLGGVYISFLLLYRAVVPASACSFCLPVLATKVNHVLAAFRFGLGIASFVDQRWILLSLPRVSSSSLFLFSP